MITDFGLAVYERDDRLDNPADYKEMCTQGWMAPELRAWHNGPPFSRREHNRLGAHTNGTHNPTKLPYVPCFDLGGGLEMV